MFGIPGGGSSLDLIDAAGELGIDFVLTRTEAAAAIMAAVTGELTGTPGVVLAGVGPGAASAVNGIAYAHLERAPLILFTDGPASSRHQAFDQNALFAPITKTQGRLRPEHGSAGIEQAIQTALACPRGPVHLDLTAADATACVNNMSSRTDEQPIEESQPPRTSVHDESRSFTAVDVFDAGDLQLARQLIGGSRRPVILVGLEARYGESPEALKELADGLSCPVLLTYKAKGVLPDSHPGTVGMFTGAVAEAETVGRADLILLYGLDPVELIPGKWRYEAPILELFPYPGSSPPASPACQLIGPLAEAVRAVLPIAGQSDWTPSEIAELRTRMCASMRIAGDGHTAQTVVELVCRAAPADCRATVDAGAHMFSVLSFWRAQQPFGALKSNGLSTMGFALPAAIASCLEQPDRQVVAFTGDGGLLMCLGELKTAAEHDCRLLVIVLNDGALSLIDIKQQRQQRASRGTRYPPADLVGVARALGCQAWHLEAHEDLAPVVARAFAHRGLTLIDVDIDPSGYGNQLAALRG